LRGVLNRIVLNRYVGQVRPGFPEAHQPLAGQQGAGTCVRASNSERGSRGPRAAGKQENQSGGAGSGSECTQKDAARHHGGSGTGLSGSSGQFAPRNIHLLAG
jgi:hypothetical protein